MPMIINKPTKSDQIGYWLFVIFISAFMLYIMLIHPAETGAWKSWGMFKSAREYELWTGGAIVSGIALVPVIIWWTNRSLKPQNNLMEDITSASLTDQIDHRQYMQLINMLPLSKTKKHHVEAARKLLDEYLAEGQK